MGDLFPKTYSLLKIGNKKSSVLTSKKQNEDVLSQHSPRATRQSLPHLSMPCSESDSTTLLGPYDTISTSSLNVFDQMETRNVEEPDDRLVIISSSTYSHVPWIWSSWNHDTPYTFSSIEFSASLSLSALLMFSDEFFYATGNIGW
jgi:hypothetical protein